MKERKKERKEWGNGSKICVMGKKNWGLRRGRREENKRKQNHSLNFREHLSFYQYTNGGTVRFKF